MNLKLLLESTDNFEMEMKIDALESQLKLEFPQIHTLLLYLKTDGVLELANIKMKDGERRKGYGSAIMKRIKAFANANNLTIILAPEAEPRYKEKLDKWYKSHGFVVNKGRHSDTKISSPFAKTMYRRPGIGETVISEVVRLKSITVLDANVLHKLVGVAQAQYDAWAQDEEGYDEELGTGGICHLIADDIADILNDHGITCSTVSSSWEQHVYLVGQFREGVYMIDIPYNVYETGGGFTWKKRKDVKFDPSHVQLTRLDMNPRSFKKYIDDM